MTTNNSTNGNGSEKEQMMQEAYRILLGSDDAPNPTDDVLRYPVANRAPFRRVAINSSKTSLDRAALDEIEQTLLADIIRSVKGTAAAELSLHHLGPELAVSSVYDELSGVSPVTSAINTHVELHDRFKVASQLAKGKPSPLRDEIDNAAGDAVSSQFLGVEQSLRDTAENAPFALAARCKQVKEHLGGVTYPETNFEGINNLAALIALSKTIRNDPTAIPAHKQKGILAAVNRAAQEPCQSVLRDVIADSVRSKFSAHAAELLHQLDNYDERNASRSLGLSLQLLTDAAQATQPSLAGILPTPGPTKRQLLNELARLYHCQPSELATHIGRSLLETLQQRVLDKGQIDVSMQWGSVLAHCTSEEIRDVYRDLLSPALHTNNVWASIRSYGLEETVDGLNRLADPFVHLNRDHLVFNIEITATAVLYAPTPTSKADEATLSDLRRGLEKDYQNLKLIEKPADTQEIRLVKTIAGFSAAIESINHDLFDVYVRSSELGHHCHLFDVIPDSPDGKASPIATELFDSLNT